MAQEKPKSRPEPSDPAPQPGQPAPPEDVYGGQWGSSGKQNSEETPEAFPPVRIAPERTQK